jgi:Flp pilus assembly protein TadG
MFASRKPAAQRRRIGRVPAAPTAPLLQRLRADQSGNVAMLFGLLIIPLAGMIGLAVDFGRVYSVTSHTQAALDAAALAAGRTAQLNPNNAMTQASAAATAYFNQAKPQDVVSSTLQFSPNAAFTQFTVTATSWVRTPFLSVLYSISHKAAQGGAPAACASNGFGCVVFTATATSALCPSDACTTSGGGGSNVETALMLDVTGSMCSPCSKIQAVQSSRYRSGRIRRWRWRRHREPADRERSRRRQTTGSRTCHPSARRRPWLSCWPPRTACRGSWESSMSIAT